MARGDTGVPIRLRGVNRSGLEYADPGPAGAAPPPSSSSVAFDEPTCGASPRWGANVMRVPFTQDFVLRGRGAANGADYLAALDQVVAWAAARGVYTLLDLQWIDAETPRGIGQDGSINRVPALPDAGSIELWRDPGVALPRPAVGALRPVQRAAHADATTTRRWSASARTAGCGACRRGVVGMDEWQPWALRLVAEIRAVHPTR